MQDELKNELDSQNRYQKCPNQIYNKHEMNKNNWDNKNRDKNCEACGYSNRKIHCLLKKIHHGNSKVCMLR